MRIYRNSLPVTWDGDSRDTGNKYEEALAKLQKHFDIKENVP